MEKQKQRLSNDRVQSLRKQREITKKNSQASKFISIPILFSGTEEMTLTLYGPHLLKRWSQRMNKQFESDRQCAEYMAALLEDERLLTIYERVPVYGSVALYMEAIRTYFFLNMGTRMNPDEIKISTVLYRSHDKMRVLVSDEDYCYVLPSEGKLRYGREKKYFERGKISGLKK